MARFHAHKEMNGSPDVQPEGRPPLTDKERLLPMDLIKKSHSVIVFN
jgi:hypothetical protein